MSEVFVAGHKGLVGSAICRRLKQSGIEPLFADRSALDLTDQSAVDSWFAGHEIDQVYLAAANVGGIYANDTYPAEFIRDNLAIQTNVIHAAWKSGVKKLLFLGSSCIYPRLADQPIGEDSLLTGELEPTNEWYAVAKIAGIKMCQAYRKQYGFDAISVMPTNLYGPRDNFDLETSHVLPALIRKFHEAKAMKADAVEIWGTGKPRREFLHVEDLADACVFLMNNYSEAQIINVGWGQDIR
jgi:GDP-L-fucose synthase